MSLTKPNLISIVLISLTALIAFAANSVLARMALKATDGTLIIDPSSYTLIRFVSGAIMLAIIVKIQLPQTPLKQLIKPIENPSWLGPLSLIGYGGLFSFAYIGLDTATGALILFGAVQFTMLVYNYLSGNQLTTREWLGAITAFAGFIYLMLPSAQQPEIWSAILMFAAGVCWAFYTLEGKKAKVAIVNTAENVIRSIPFALLIIIAASLLGQIDFNQITDKGILLACISGAITSGLGYSIWYQALKHLTVTQAAVCQLSVPVIAAIGGVIFVNEPISQQLVIAGVMILGGIMLVSVKR